MASVYKNNRSRASQSHLSKSIGGWLLGGLGVGAVIMYFLDPQAGSDRRESAKRLASQATEHLANVRKTVKSALQANSVEEAVEEIAQALPAHQEEKSSSCPFLPMATTAIGCGLLGAAVMYLLDPSSGNRRRGYLRDTASSRARMAAELVNHKARHVRNKAQGIYHDATKAVQNSRFATSSNHDDDADSR